MELRVLVDNNTYIDQYYYGEPAVSYYIEDEDVKILFDTGYSDLFINNSKKLGIELKGIDSIVLSHGHDDHSGGLKHYFNEFSNPEMNLYAHPHAFNRKYFGNMSIGPEMLASEIEQKCYLNLTREPLKISKNMYFLGEIPCTNNFERPIAIGKQVIGSRSEDDFILDDTAMLYRSNQGLFIVTGCSHSGICNIIDFSMKVCGDDRIIGIIGGFHMFELDEKTSRTIDYLKQWPNIRLYPCHCTSFEVKTEIHRSIPVKEVGVGLNLEI